jgi:hypothetical protein
MASVLPSRERHQREFPHRHRPRYRPIASKNWAELVAAAQSDVVISDLDVFAHTLVVSERRGGLPHIGAGGICRDGAGAFRRR